MARVCGSVQLGRRDHAIAVLVKSVETGPFHGQEFGARNPAITIGVGTAQAALTSVSMITASTASGTITAFATLAAMAATHGARLLAFGLVSGLAGTRFMHRPHPLADRRLIGSVEITIAIAIHPLEHFHLQRFDFGLGDGSITIGIGHVQHHHATAGPAAFAMSARAVRAATTRLGIGCRAGHNHGRACQQHCEN
tara:strand:+ start:10028 stop:10615 length:588 start_codon:yes stop_codon:yes gene_type:complete